MGGWVDEWMMDGYKIKADHPPLAFLARPAIFLFNEHLFSSNLVHSTVQGPRNTQMNKTKPLTM